MASEHAWYRDHALWLEIFVLFNLAGLAPDIYLAHSTNDFLRWTEYVPLYFSLAGAVLLLAAIVGRLLRGWETAWRLLGYLVGSTAVVVGVTGMILHLESHFFRERTLASLVYSAPFAAPLAYVGLGLLLVMNRMIAADSEEWPRWVLLFALGGFIGNFIFCLTDHAQNGFFATREWLSVISAAVAVGFLLVPFLMAVPRSYLGVCAGVLLLQGVIGMLGFYFHGTADLHGSMPTLFENVVYGAPILAPLLFADVMLLGWLGLWVWARRHAG